MNKLVLQQKAAHRNRLNSYATSTPVTDGDKIYCLNEKGKCTVMKAGPAFVRVAENELGEKCLASPAISAGKIFIRTEANLYCIGQ